MRKFSQLLILLLFITGAGALSAVEFGGGKFEYMNSKETSFMGFGLFTSNKRFDAEIEGFVAPEYFSGSTSSAGYLGDNYRLFFVAFSGYFHFIRTDKMSLFVGGGIMPWLPKTYAYHFAAGMDFFFSENWRIFYQFRYMDNNAENYRYPTGTSVAVGFKYAFRLLNI
ncbi:hypothetical protein [Turneriella parva]|uniref:Outer membrane protein beta-barrel domain-containing protein n=1 Tax=Turneriella parva (strain ATCC BAA-1111 / DSM 21527 / NCTC 11395 / H) TaxID=869212 RepID=I4BBX4_TURPD|nr:hypothetical protein [Turneriella parva]AFM14781.1 hypothetical protein Turpa_4148 [Turneriella parva DSM 21527]